jgi:2-dehydro-3-deoxygalactonokinase
VKAAPRPDDPCLVGVDAGTTKLRAWLLHGEHVLARREVPVGARDTARDRSDARLRAALRTAVGGLLRERPREVPPPARIVAAGMITSAQGLVEVPHVAAPASLADVAAGAREETVSDVSELPFLFVPGVRTPAAGATPDVMRGEETLCLGLLQQGRLSKGASLLTIGSHWKLVATDGDARVAGSVTSLSGEMVQAVRTQTILASALPEGLLADADAEFLRAGMAEARRAGLPRALFAVRLREMDGAGTPEQRLAFLLGAFVAADLDGLRASGALRAGSEVAVAGDEKFGGAWTRALGREGHAVRRLAAEDVEAGFLAGLRAIVAARRG